MKRISVLLSVWVGVSGMAMAANAQVSDGIELDGMQLDSPVTDIGDPNSAEFVAPAPPAVEHKKSEVVEPAEPEAREIPTIDTNAQAHSHADVSYVTGGIGEDEKLAIEAAKGDYNLHVMSASNSGAFVGEARVIITRKKGKDVEEMLSVTAGPLLYVNLPAGTYTLQAVLGEQSKKQSFTVAKGKPARVHLGWKVAATPAS